MSQRHCTSLDTARSPRALLPLLLAFLVLLGLPALTHAATLTVTSTADDGGSGTLRSLIAAANPGDTITFDPTVFASKQTITLTQGTLSIAESLIITGPTAGVAVDGNSNSVFSTTGSTVFSITGGTPSSPVTLYNLTIQHGNAIDNGVRKAFSGGGLFNSSTATLTLTNCTFIENVAANGGALYNGGTATLTNCTLTRNGAESDNGLGAGLFNSSTATLTLTGCTLTANVAQVGGGLYNDNGGTATLTNCTLTGNNGVGGGGVANYGTATLTGCTFSQNSANFTGGGLYNGGKATLTNDILWNDSAVSGGPDIYNDGGTTSASYSDISQSGYTGNSNINADPLFVGAPTDLHLQAGSPCLGAGATQGEAPAGVTVPTTTIDGQTRPSPPSIGAYEVGSATDVSSQITVTRGGFVRTPRTTTLSQQVTLTNTGTSTIPGPISLVLDGLTAGTLTNKTGTTTISTGTPGSPYLNYLNSLAPNASVSVTLQFSDPTLAAITYQTRVLAGTGTR